ncbi:MAG: dihydropteroate synthase [Anaerovibrio sp.]|nr:dihydropteroate synthase [Anaerovibrio sp.]
MESNIHILSINTIKDIETELSSIGVSSRGIDIMKEKLVFLVLKLENVDTRAANIIKQTMLSNGAEAAVSAATVNLSVSHTDVIIGATIKQLRQAIQRLQEQPWGLKEIAKKIEELVD